MKHSLWVRRLSAILVVVMIAAMFSACGKTAGSETGSSAPAESSSAAAAAETPTMQAQVVAPSASPVAETLSANEWLAENLNALNQTLFSGEYAKLADTLIAKQEGLVNDALYNALLYIAYVMNGEPGKAFDLLFNQALNLNDFIEAIKPYLDQFAKVKETLAAHMLKLSESNPEAYSAVLGFASLLQNNDPTDPTIYAVRYIAALATGNDDDLTAILQDAKDNGISAESLETTALEYLKKSGVTVVSVDQIEKGISTSTVYTSGGYATNQETWTSDDEYTYMRRTDPVTGNVFSTVKMLKSTGEIVSVQTYLPSFSAYNNTTGKIEYSFEGYADIAYSNGVPKTVTIYDTNGEKTGVYSFDDNGNLTEARAVMDNEEKILGYSMSAFKYVIDSKGDCTTASFVMTDTDGNAQGYYVVGYEFTARPDGIPVWFEKYGSDNELESKTTVEWSYDKDPNGALSSMSVYHSDGSLYYKNTYDENGYATSTVHYYTQSGTAMKDIISYYPETNKYKQVDAYDVSDPENPVYTGSMYYTYNDDGTKNTVITSVDGDVAENKYAADDTLLSQKITFGDGNVKEYTFYDNGNLKTYYGKNSECTVQQECREDGTLISEEYAYIDGSGFKYTYYADESWKTYSETDAKGNRQQYEWNEDGTLINKEIVYSDGSGYTRTYYDSGSTQSYTKYYSNGKQVQTEYRTDGTVSSKETIYSNGSGYKLSYYEDGTTLKSETDTYANGTVYTFIYCEDGTTLKSETDAYADGTVYVFTYWEDGTTLKNVEETTSDGSKYQTEYRADGTLVYQLKENADGSGYTYTYYENGTKQSFIKNYSDGTYVQEEYREDGTIASKISTYDDGSELLVIYNGSEERTRLEYTEYNEEKTEKTVSVYNGSGYISTKNTYTLTDDKEILATQIVAIYQGKSQVAVIENIYDENGYLIMQYETNSTSRSYTTFEYTDGKQTAGEVYTYDESGNASLAQKISYTYDESGKLVSSTTYDVDEDGNAKYLDADNAPVAAEQTVYTYAEDGTSQQTQTSYDVSEDGTAQMTGQSVASYDASGKETAKTVTSYNGEEITGTSQTTYSYDENGELTGSKCESYNASGAKTGTEYYDAYGIQTEAPEGAEAEEDASAQSEEAVGNDASNAAAPEAISEETTVSEENASAETEAEAEAEESVSVEAEDNSCAEAEEKTAAEVVEEAADEASQTTTDDAMTEEAA